MGIFKNTQRMAAVTWDDCEVGTCYETCYVEDSHSGYVGRFEKEYMPDASVVLLAKDGTVSGHGYKWWVPLHGFSSDELAEIRAASGKGMAATNV